MSEAPQQPPSLLDWLSALARVRLLWPLPALLLLGVLLAWAPPELWAPPLTSRRTFSRAELSIVCGVLGALLYWLTLYLSHMGLLQLGTRMREPSEGEQRMVDGATRALCLMIAYGGPLLLLLR